MLKLPPSKLKVSLAPQHNGFSNDLIRERNATKADQNALDAFRKAKSASTRM